MSVLYVRDGSGKLIPVKTIQGAPGEKGEQGEPGNTPIKGTDYWTEADQQAIVGDVLKALPTWTGGSY